MAVGILGGVSILRTWVTSRSLAPPLRAARSRGAPRPRRRRPGPQARRRPCRDPPGAGAARVRGRSRSDVELDRHARTVDSLEERRPDDAVFILGADELADFVSWKSPERVLELVRLARRDAAGCLRATTFEPCASASQPDDRIVEFEMEPVPVSSSEIRERVARGEPIDELVPARGRRGDRASRASTRRRVDCDANPTRTRERPT